MKCDHLIGRILDDGDIYILASDVIEAISELKQAIKIKDDLLIENGKEIGRLKAENERLKEKEIAK